MQLEWDAAVRCDCVQMNLSALAPGAWVRPCNARRLWRLSVQREKRAGPGGHRLHTRQRACWAVTNAIGREDRHTISNGLGFLSTWREIGKKHPVIVGVNKKRGRCHYRNIQVKDTAVEKKLCFCALSKGLDKVQMWRMHIQLEGVCVETLCSRSVVPPPVSCNTEIYEWIMGNNYWWEARGIVLYGKKKGSFRSRQHQPPSSLSSVPIDLSGLYF